MTKPKQTFRQQMSGFPIWQMFVINVIRFAEPIAFTSLFPYVYFMIRDFGIAKNESEVSKYSGYLSASFAFCQFLCSIHWGKAADKIGRKPVLMIGLIGTSTSLLLFGFSTNFYSALFARSLMGSLNGNVAVLRTCIGEVAVERRHQAVAFSTLPLVFNIGSVIGPLIGGSKYLTRPKGKNPYDHDPQDENEIIVKSIKSFYENFIDKYPYALSNIVVAIGLWFSLIFGFLFLEETHPTYKNRKDYGLDIGDKVLNFLGYPTKIRPWNPSYLSDRPQFKINGTVQNEATDDALIDDIDSIDETTPLTANPPNQSNRLYNTLSSAQSIHSANSSDSIDSVGPISRRMSIALIRTYSKSAQNNELERPLTRTTIQTIEEGFNSRCFTPAVVQTILSNFLLSLHCLVYDEFLPVFLAQNLNLDKLQFPFKIVGGFGYSSDSIGKLLSTTGFIGVVIIVFIFPYVDRNFNPISAFKFFTSIFPIVYFLLPFVIFTLKTSLPSWLPSASIYSLTAIKTLGSANSFPQILLLIHRSAPSKHRAYINGCTISASALARFVGPVVWGYLMSWGESREIGWLSWWVLSLVSLGGTIQAYSMEEVEDEEEEGGEEVENVADNTQVV